MSDVFPSLTERIATRNELAEKQLEGQGIARRAIGTVGLHAGNAVDVAHNATINSVTKTAFGMAIGAIRGAFWGVVGVGLLILATEGVGITMAIAAPIVLGASALYSIVKGYQSYQAYLISDKRFGSNLAEGIARQGGALPAPEVQQQMLKEIEAERRQKSVDQMRAAATRAPAVGTGGLDPVTPEEAALLESRTRSRDTTNLPPDYYQKAVEADRVPFTERVR